MYLTGYERYLQVYPLTCAVLINANFLIQSNNIHPNPNVKSKTALPTHALAPNVLLHPRPPSTLFVGNVFNKNVSDELSKSKLKIHFCKSFSSR